MTPRGVLVERSEVAQAIGHGSAAVDGSRRQRGTALSQKIPCTRTRAHTSTRLRDTNGQMAGGGVGKELMTIMEACAAARHAEQSMRGRSCMGCGRQS